MKHKQVNKFNLIGAITINISGKQTKVYVYCCILGYSRLRIYEASLCQTQSSVFDALQHSLFEIGEVTEKIQNHNPKYFVSNPPCHNFQWNLRYLIDELGYSELSNKIAFLFFKLIPKRNKKVQLWLHQIKVLKNRVKSLRMMLSPLILLIGYFIIPIHYSLMENPSK